MNNSRIFLVVNIIIIMMIIIYYLRSPISNALLTNNEIKIVFVGSKNGIITYNPLSKNVSIKVTSQLKNKTNSLYQHAYQIYIENEKEIRDVFYVYLYNTDFIKTLFGWKDNPKLLIDIIKSIYLIQTNITFFEKITLLPIFLNIKPSQIIFIKNQNKEELGKNEKNKTITVEIINATTNKETIKKIKSILMKNKIDILEEKKQKNHKETRIIIDSIDKYSYAKKISKILGIEKEIIIDKRPSICDVILIIADDYKED